MVHGIPSLDMMQRQVDEIKQSVQNFLIPWYHQLVGIDPGEQVSMDSTLLEFTNLTISMISMKKNGLSSGTAIPLTGAVERVRYSATQYFEEEKFPSF